MICPVCGQQIADGLAVCPICGVALTATQNPVPTPQSAAATPSDVSQNAAPQATPQYAPNTAQQFPVTAAPYAAPAAAPYTGEMPKNARQLIKRLSHVPQYKKMGTEIAACGIVFYVFAGINILFYAASGNLVAGIIEAIVLAGLGLWIHLGYSRVASIIALIYSIFSVVITFVNTGKLQGYLILIVAVYAVMCTFNVAKVFKKFKQNPSMFPLQ